MGISSAGIGSGLDVQSLVSSLVAVEKQPLTALQKTASSIQTKLSTLSQISSMVSTLGDAAAKLALPGTWDAMTASTSNSAAVSATVTGRPSAGSFSLGIQKLASAQTVVSAARGVAGTAVGEGTLNIQLGGWGDPASPSFAPGAAAAVSVSITATDTLSTIASKLNGANAGVTATVLTDASGERLMVRSNGTGADSGFRITAVESGSPGLSSLAFDPQGATGVGMAVNPVQYGQNAAATLNGIAISSATNTFANTLTGLSFTASQVTTSPVEVTVSPDTAAMKKQVQSFVDAYNAINDLLASSTKYDAATKTAGVFQGDGTAVSMQNALRSLMVSSSSASVFTRLHDIGVDMASGGKLNVTDTKLDNALKNPSAMKSFFASSVSAGASEDGLAVKLKSFANNLLASDGMVTTKTSSLNSAIKRNSSDQEKLNARVALVEARLRAQYTALDTKMGSLTALSGYVSQQISQWNKVAN